MTNCGRRGHSPVTLAVVILWGVLWTYPMGWGQETTPPEASTAAPDVSTTLNKTPAPAPESRALPAPETKTGPIKYTVREGDTLWGISNAHLRNSFLWPKLWRNNRSILNPDLIYPGNVIELPGEEPAPRTALVETAQPTAPALPSLPPPTVEPPTVEKIEKPAPVEVEKSVEVTVPIPEAPVPEVKPLDQGLLAASGYILTGQRGVGVVVGARDNRELIGLDETVYLLAMKGSQLRVGDRYTVFRMVRKVYHPRTGKYMGNLIRILGMAEVIGANPREKTVSAKVLISYDSIQKGDLLMPVEAPEGASDERATAVSPSGHELRGVIVEVKEDRVAQAQSDVVYLDRGRQHGVRAGDRFAVVREGQKTDYFSPGGGVRLPRRVIGELEIIAVQEATATAKVLQNTEVIFKGDRFETRPAP